MGCSCSRDAETPTARRRTTTVDGAARGTAHPSDFPVAGEQRGAPWHDSDDGDASDENSNAASRRRAQEEADFVLAQLLFQEQLMFVERQQRLAQRAQQRGALASPVLPGLNDIDFDRIGKVVRYDPAATSKLDRHPASSAGVDQLASPSSSRSPTDHHGGDELPSSPVFSGATPNYSFVPGAEGTVAECDLCMEELAAGCELRTLACGHGFHKKCVDDWLRRKRICPMCQQDVTVMPPATRDARPLASAPAAGEPLPDLPDAAAPDVMDEELVQALALSMLAAVAAVHGDGPQASAESPTRPDARSGDAAAGHGDMVGLSAVVLALLVASAAAEEANNDGEAAASAARASSRVEELPDDDS